MAATTRSALLIVPHWRVKSTLIASLCNVARPAAIMQFGITWRVRMGIDRCWMVAVLASAALAACASPSSPGARGGAPPAAPSASPQQVYVTGSRVAVPVDPHTGLPQSAAPVQIISQDQLSRSGYTQLGAALRTLVPALH